MTPTRLAKLATLVSAKQTGLFTLARKRSAGKIRILCYHGVWLGTEGYPGDAMFMSAETYRRRIDLLVSLEYPVIPLDHAVDALRGVRDAPPDAVVITIDDGWWSTYREMLEPLRAHGLPATLYCDTRNLESGRPVAHMAARSLRAAAAPPEESEAAQSAFADATDFARDLDDRQVALRVYAEAIGVDLDAYLEARAFHYMTPDELRSAAAEGLDVQLHTHNHTLGDLSAETIAREVAANRASLAAILGRDGGAFQHFCYPSGVADRAAADALAELGLKSSTTTAAGLASGEDHPQLLPRILDGENLTDLEFEAELSGFADWLRALKDVPNVG